MNREQAKNKYKSMKEQLDAAAEAIMIYDDPTIAIEINGGRFEMLNTTDLFVNLDNLINNLMVEADCIYCGDNEEDFADQADYELREHLLFNKLYETSEPEAAAAILSRLMNMLFTKRAVRPVVHKELYDRMTGYWQVNFDMIFSNAYNQWQNGLK